MAPIRGLTLLGAPSNIGIRPYDDGRLRALDRAPALLRTRGLMARIGAKDLGDVHPPAYEDFVRPPRYVRNETPLVQYSGALAERIANAGAHGDFVVLIGGDCSIVVGATMGASRLVGDRAVGLAYVDAHADFATEEESYTGSAASMCLAMVAGHGNTALARMAGASPLVRPTDIALVGRRDEGEPYGHAALRPLGVHDVPYADVRSQGIERTVAEVTAILTKADLAGFWIHVDADVLDESIMPAVDSPTPDGPGLDDLVALVAPLVRHPRALGMQLTIYDPGLDPDGACAELLVTFLEQTLAGGPTS
ncbi:MAG: arginase family protein [Cytophagaceae bacterium]|nr:arginase family protein [Gemmatimonadaceae bacterium]